MSEPQQIPPRRPRRWLRRLLLLPLVLWLLYVVGANAFLASAWGRKVLNRKPEKLSLQWTKARTWVPGFVRVEGLEIGGHARRADWRATVERGRMVIWLPSLVRRHFRLLRGTAEGAEVEVLVKPPPETPRPPAKKEAWWVSLDGLRVPTLHSIRINEHTLQGPGAVRGSTRFKVRGPTEIHLSRIDFPEARLFTGDEVAADPVRLIASLDLEPFVVGEDKPPDILAGASGTLELEAKAEGLDFLDAYLERFPWLDLGGRGDLTIEAEFSRGWLAPGSRLRLEGPAVAATFFGLEAEGQGRIDGWVPEGASHTELLATLDRFQVLRAEDQRQLLEGGGLTLAVISDTAAFDRPAEGLSLELDLPATSVPDVGALGDYIPRAAGVELLGGQASLAAHLTYSSVERSGDGWLDLQADDLQAKFGDLEFAGELDLDARFPQAGLEDGVVRLAGTELSLQGIQVSGSTKPKEEGWWGRIRVPDGQIVQRAGQELRATRIEADVEADLRDTGPLVALIEQRVPKLSWFDDLLTVENVKALSAVELDREEIGLAGLEVSGGKKQRLEILGELKLRDKEAEGVFFARWGPLSAAVALEDGERDWKLTRSRRWYEEQAAAYRGGAAASPIP